MNTKTLYKISYGLYVVSAIDGERRNGQIANTVFQITSEPPTVAVSINKQNLTHEFIEKSGAFTVSILSKDVPMTVIGHFGFKSGRELEKFNGVAFKTGISGAPIVLDYVVGYLEARVIQSVDVGSHTIFIGEVTDADLLGDAEPMTYTYYHEVKRGKAPKTAPTYIKEESEKVVKNMDRYECSVCGYVYNPEEGDPDSGVEPGVPFDELPSTWVCPMCGAEKDQFVKVQ